MASAPMEIEPDIEPTLYLVVKNKGVLNGLEDYSSIPKVVSLSRKKYQLGVINMCDMNKSHHTSLHQVNCFGMTNNMSKHLR
jgi:hypothetical protein